MGDSQTSKAEFRQNKILNESLEAKRIQLFQLKTFLSHPLFITVLFGKYIKLNA